MVMKKDKVVFSLKAKLSLQEIVKYLKENASTATATYVRKGIIEKCKGLKDFSGYAKERYLEDLPQEYRSVYVWDYIIIYKIADQAIWILNIIHTHRNPQKRMDL
jgi:plasmid stabilization system protein ParE